MAPRRLSYVMPVPEHLQKGKEDAISDLKMIHNEIKYDWPQILQSNANPIEVAVAFLDDTSVGLAHRLKEFSGFKRRTEGVLRHVVDEHYELFSNSIGSYHMLLSSLNQSKQDSKEIKEFLELSKKEVSDRSSLLAELAQSSARYEEMIEILDAIKLLNNVPDEIDQLIAEKKIHEIYNVISNAYKTAERYSLWSLPALAEVKIYLEEQSNKLHDMIVDELQSEIYSKNDRSITKNGESIWQTLITSKSPQMASFITLLKLENLEQYVYNSANFDISEVVDYLTEPVRKFLFDQLLDLHIFSTGEEGAVNYKVLLQTTLNPNSESYHYIYKLLLTASKLGRLDQVVATLVQSNQLELQGLINRTTEEVKSKNGHALSKLMKNLHYVEKDSLFDVMTGNNFNDSSVVILLELFGSIIVKCLITFQKHKVVNEVCALLNGKPASTISPNATNIAPSNELLYIWNITKSEIENLIMSYIYNEEAYSLGTPLPLLDQKNAKTSTSATPATTTTATAGAATSSSILPTSVASSTAAIKQQSMKNKLFKFENVDWSTTKSAQELASSLTEIFPGFHLEDEDDKDALEMKTPYFEDEAFNDQLEVLVPKNLFNMRIILEPFLIFIDGSHRLFANFTEPKSTKSVGKQDAYQFFNTFMKSSFLSYFEDAIELVFGEQVGGSYAKDVYTGATEPSGLKLDLISLNRDSQLKQLGKNSVSKLDSNLVIYENAYNFKKLFLELCLILNTSLTYREEISNLVLKTLQSFATEYGKLFQDLLASNEGQLNRPVLRISKWMNLHTLSEFSGDILILREQQKHQQQHEEQQASEKLPLLVDAENRVILAETKDVAVVKDDLLDNDSLTQVVHLLLTATWVLSWIHLIKKESNYNIFDDEQNREVEISVVEKLRYNWSFLESGRPVINFTADTSDITKNNIYLALNLDKNIEFDKIVHTFKAIRDHTVLALRYELRSKAIYYVSLSYNVMEWVSTTEPGDADPYIVLLNQEIFAIDNKLTRALKYDNDDDYGELDGDSDEKESVFIGFSQFLNDLIIQRSSTVKKINTNGVKRILLNISTLQQTLRSLSSNPATIDFNKSLVYFEMFALNEFSMLNRIKLNRDKLTKEQYYNLARLIYSEKLADGNGSLFNKGKYNELIKKIDEVLK